MSSSDLHPSHRRRITSGAVGIGLATGAYGLSFGAISVASGLTALQTQTLSLLMFTGGSQFALVGVLGAGGGAVAAILTAWLLGARNGMYALSMAPTLQVTGLRRLAAAELTIDESTAMALAHPDPPDGRPFLLPIFATKAALAPAKKTTKKTPKKVTPP